MPISVCLQAVTWGGLWGTVPLKQQLISVAHTICHSPRATFGARSCDETALNPRAVGADGIDLAVVDPANFSH